MAHRLTPKQEKFVQALVAGSSQREAYRAAYRCEKSSDKTVDNKAHALFKKGEIRARYDALMAELADRVLWDRERACRELLEIRKIATLHVRHVWRESREFPFTSSKFLADTTAELNKMFGIYEKAGAEGGAVPVIIDDIPRESR